MLQHLGFPCRLLAVSREAAPILYSFAGEDCRVLAQSPSNLLTEKWYNLIQKAIIGPSFSPAPPSMKAGDDFPKPSQAPETRLFRPTGAPFARSFAAARCFLARGMTSPFSEPSRGPSARLSFRQCQTCRADTLERQRRGNFPKLSPVCQRQPLNRLPGEIRNQPVD